ncbi:MAG: arsenic transporter [Chthoniobacter sp.]|nr:arsenic transporter [Chthoniobacter sp.]
MDHFHFQTLSWPVAAIWLIVALTIGCVLGRPWGLAEAWWATGGAVLMVIGGLLPWPVAVFAVGKGMDVYLFLAGMMLLSELARREGVFDWCASVALGHARGSPVRLFWLIYAVGVVITVFLSNDATAVVLTPAVFAVTKTAKVARPLPYLFACALVANAASFVLPISNPANLVLFDGHMPPLLDWLKFFTLPSLLSVAATGGALFAVTRGDLRAPITEPMESAHLSRGGRAALGGIAFAVVVLLTASALHQDLGAPTLGVAILALGTVAFRDRTALWETPRHVSWSVLPLVAGLFVIVEAVNRAGALEASQQALAALERLPAWQGDLAGAFGITALSNLINNLPSGLISGTAITHGPVSDSLRNALLIGVDLGPNLSVTGSLATILWLIVLRREKQQVSAWSFLKVGVVVTPVALVLAVLASTFLKLKP